MILALAFNPVQFMLAFLLLCVVCWGVQYLGDAYGLPQPIKATVIFFLVLVFVLFVIAAFGGLPGVHL